jgi:hypothetical protein
MAIETRGNLKAEDFHPDDLVEVRHAQNEWRGLMGRVLSVNGTGSDGIIKLLPVKGTPELSLEKARKKNDLGFYAWRLEKVEADSGVETMKLCVICGEERDDHSLNFCPVHKGKWGKWSEKIATDEDKEMQDFVKRGAPEPPELMRIEGDHLETFLDTLEEIGYEFSDDHYIAPKKAG